MNLTLACARLRATGKNGDSAKIDSASVHRLVLLTVPNFKDADLFGIFSYGNLGGDTFLHHHRIQHANFSKQPIVHLCEKVKSLGFRTTFNTISRENKTAFR